MSRSEDRRVDFEVNLTTSINDASKFSTLTIARTPETPIIGNTYIPAYRPSPLARP